jgi:hypothetical protein
MDKMLDRLSSYNILNYLIPGVLFLVLLDILNIVATNESNVLLMLFGGYFAGMVISRVGSVVIEPWFKKCKIVKYASYNDYIKAEGKDSKIPMLLSEINMFRSFIAMFLLILVLYGICMIPTVKEWLRTPWAVFIIITLLLILFVVSYRKHATYIRKRVESAVKK